MSSKGKSFYGIKRKKANLSKRGRSQKDLRVPMFHKVGELKQLEDLTRCRIRWSPLTIISTSKTMQRQLILLKDIYS
jgi:hypothetical protein